MDVICNGTSMAVPHAVGAASLLWQKDITKPAQFIRELMKASSKTITDDNGDKFSYIDYAYAEKIYDDLCKSYKKKGNAVKPDKKYKNNGKIKSFEGEVEARWSKANHEKTVEYASNHAGGLTANQVNIVKVGVRAPDIYYGASDYEGLKMFHAMKQNNPDGSVCFFNYVKVYEDIMNMALKCKKDGIGAAQSLAFPDGSSGVYSECVTARNYLRKQELTVMLNQAGYEYSSKNGALVLMGISMHVVGDAYAHRAYIFNGNGGYIRPDTDNIASYEERFSCAKKSCADVLGLWNGACPPSFAEFIVSGYNGVFGLEKLYTFAMQSWNGIDFYSYEASLRKRSCKD